MLLLLAGIVHFRADERVMIILLQLRMVEGSETHAHLVVRETKQISYCKGKNGNMFFHREDARYEIPT